MPITSATRPLIIGHRGASALAPENTLISFGNALDSGAAGVEFDVRLASDGVPVVIHDATLKRTGLCAGAVARMTSRELNKIDVGSWFNRDHPRLARTEYESELLPSLDQAFGSLKQHRNGPGLIYLEMKTGKADSYVALGDAVIDLARAHELQDHLVVVSFNLKALAHIKNLAPSIKTGALFELRRSTVKIIRKQPMIATTIECGADQILLHHLIATRRTVSAATDRNLATVVWTVDAPKWISRAKSLGIYGLITNNPSAMAALVVANARNK